MTLFTIINTGRTINSDLEVKQKKLTKSFDPSKKKENISSGEKENSLLYRFNNDQASINILERQIREALSNHMTFLNDNLPLEVDIKIVRDKKTEQLEHYLRKDNKFFFKTIQELFLSKEEKDRKNRQDKISAESTQRDSLLGNIPRIKLSTDYAKDFNPQKPPLIFDKFLTELRKSVPNSIQSENVILESNKIITELMVLHESAHIIFDNKINKTYLKLAYEINDKNYDGSSLQQFARLIHEGFADGITTFLEKKHPNSGVYKCYRDARNKTKHKTESEDKLNIYDTVDIIDKVIRLDELNKNNAVNIIFKLAVDNALNKLENKLNSSKKFQSSFIKDLKSLQDKKCITIELSNIIEGLKNNIFEQLNNPLPIMEILKNEEKVESKKQVFKNMDFILKKFRSNDSTNDNKLKM